MFFIPAGLSAVQGKDQLLETVSPLLKVFIKMIACGGGGKETVFSRRGQAGGRLRIGYTGQSPAAGIPGKAARDFSADGTRTESGLLRRVKGFRSPRPNVKKAPAAI